MKVIEKVGEILTSLEQAGFSVQPAFSLGPDYGIATTFKLEGVEMRLAITHDVKQNMLVFIVYFPEELPMGECDIFAVLNEINVESPLGHFVFSESTNDLTFRFGYFLLEKEFNQLKFKEILLKLLYDILENYPLLKKLLDKEGANA